MIIPYTKNYALIAPRSDLVKEISHPKKRNSALDAKLHTTTTSITKLDTKNAETLVATNDTSPTAIGTTARGTYGYRDFLQRILSYSGIPSQYKTTVSSYTFFDALAAKLHTTTTTITKLDTKNAKTLVANTTDSAKNAPKRMYSCQE